MDIDQQINCIDDSQCDWDENVHNWASDEENIDQTDPENNIEYCQSKRLKIKKNLPVTLFPIEVKSDFVVIA